MKLIYVSLMNYDMFDSMASSLGSGLVGGVLGMALQDQNNQNQLQQQRALNGINFDYFKQTSDYNLQNQLSLWNQTNYPAQVAQLEKAGLNPGLLYSKGGMGGTTAANPGSSPNSQAPSSSGANVAMASQMMNLQLVKAQAENINADTELKKQQAADTAGSAANRPIQGQNIQAQTSSLTQGIQNQQAVEALTKIQTQLEQVNLDFQKASMYDRLDILSQTARKLTGEATTALVQGNVDEATKNTKIASIQQSLVQQYAQTELTKTVNENEMAKIPQWSEQLALAYMQLANNKDQTAINERIAQFETDGMNKAAEILSRLLHITPIIPVGKQ